MTVIADSPIEWVRSMRLQLLDSLFELSSVHLQEACWGNAQNNNPHYSLIEFVASSPLSNIEALNFQQMRGVITKQEHNALLPLAHAVSAYKPPAGDWHTEVEVLRDPDWKEVTRVAASSLNNFLLCSFNSDSTIEQLVKMHVGSAGPA